MRLNYETCLSGSKCLLVPYRPEHVETYHEWMKSPFLLEATGSEPLSLEEEIKMQLSWRDDDDKCTFIVLDRSLVLCEKGSSNLDEMLVTEKEEDHENTNTEEQDKKLTAGDESTTASASASASAEEFNFITKSLDAMVGDVNLFLSDDDDNDDDGDDNDGNNSQEVDSKTKPTKRMAELDVMIAEPDARGKGIGKECACMMMLYAAKHTHLNICKFVVRINEDNVASRKMFEHALGFREVNYAACFQQYEYEFKHETCEAAIEALEKIICDASDGIQKWHVPL
jgi:RimJ/RimL family protein N-acetyltransferase